MTDQATPDISTLLKAITPWDKVKGSGTPQFCADVADQWDRFAQQARSEDDRMEGFPMKYETTDYSARNRGQLWCFLATTDRLGRTWLSMMGILYLTGAPISLKGIGVAGAVGFIWAAVGMLWGDAFWGWPGLLTRNGVKNGA